MVRPLLTTCLGSVLNRTPCIRVYAYRLPCVQTRHVVKLSHIQFANLMRHYLRHCSERHIAFDLLTYLLTDLLTHSLTPRSRVLLKKLIVSQSVKKFPAFYRTRRFITTFPRAGHLSLSWTRPIQPISILSPIYAGSSKWSLSLRFPTKTLYTPLLSPYVLRPHSIHSSSFDHPNNISGGIQIIKLLIM